MELIFPWVLYIGIPVVILLPFIGFKKRDRYKKGNRVANTVLVEETELYKKLMKRYKIMAAFAMLFLLVAIGSSFGLMSRPAKIETVTHEIQNRDIFFCMDVSSSIDELNLEMCDELRGVIKDLDGERIGISIFNAKSVLLVPLTTDYEYVLSVIDKLEESCEVSLGLTEATENDDYDLDFYLNFDYATYYYKYEGTLSDQGSSFIGDGLASCLYSFPDLEENDERTRLIIFTTDNELNGEPLLSVEEAAGLCKKHDVKVFAIAPERIVDEESFKAAIEGTGGKFYKSTESGVYEDLVSEIKKTEASNTIETRVLLYDQPQLLFIILIVAEGLYFMMCRRAKL